MSDQEQATEEMPADEQVTGNQPEEDATEESLPDFEEHSNRGPANPVSLEMSRFGGVQVCLTAQLGRANLTIKEMLALAEGAVVELDREISQPVELIAQGVPLGNGEVVVVDDRFAIRIKEIYQV